MRLIEKVSRRQRNRVSTSLKKIFDIHVTKRYTIHPRLFISFQIGSLFCKKNGFVENVLIKCFNNFVESAVGSREQSGENPESSVTAGTMTLLANTALSYEISRQSVIRYLSNEKQIVLLFVNSPEDKMT